MNGGVNIWQLVLDASLFVKVVMVILVVFSFLSWVIIFRKRALLGRAMRGADEFEERFWSGADLAGLFREVTSGGGALTGIENIFESGFREFARLRASRPARRAHDPRGQQRVRIARRRDARTRSPRTERSRVPRQCRFDQPYVGLLGTVAGIMVAFVGLANMKEATIATVAPGIAEALIATAMGLIAAIPAVWAYNRYQTKLERISTRYDTFVEEFSSILQRQTHTDEVP